MKKKVLAISLAVALIAIVVSGSLAYFTAEDEVTNTFTIGSVDIEIFENDTETTEDVRSLGTLTPIVKIETPSADVSYIKKAVDVKNTGINDAYIRTHIAIPEELVGYLHLDLDESGWTRRLPDTEATVGEQDYVVFTYDYNAAVKSGEFTTELLKGVYLGSDVDIKDNPDTASADLEFCKPNGNGTYTFSKFVAHSKVDGGYKSSTVSILVASEAIQTAGFESGATAALNSGFGGNTNPWQ